MNHCKDKLDPILLKEVDEILSPFPEAYEFAKKYKDYVHILDDLVDEDKGTEKILIAASKASELFTMPFWRQFGPSLIVLEQVINNTYADSVEWENDALEFKRRDSMVLRHAGIEMFFAIILLTAGRESLRKISSRFRAQCHELHMNEKGEGV